MPYVIAEPCISVKDRSCVDVCPVDCIYEGPDMLYIHPDECIDCGACEPECPVTAIFPEEDVPPQWKDYIAKNRDVFQREWPSCSANRSGSYPSPYRKATMAPVGAGGCSRGLDCQPGCGGSRPGAGLERAIASISAAGAI